MFDQHRPSQEKPVGSYESKELFRLLGVAESDLLVFYQTVNSRVRYYDTHPANNAQEEEEERQSRELLSFALDKLLQIHKTTELLN